jgi:hypothetical protein
VFEEQSASVVGELDGAAGQGLGVVVGDLPAVEQGEDQSVDQEWA